MCSHDVHYAIWRRPVAPVRHWCPHAKTGRRGAWWASVRRVPLASRIAAASWRGEKASLRRRPPPHLGEVGDGIDPCAAPGLPTRLSCPPGRSLRSRARHPRRRLRAWRGRARPAAASARAQPGRGGRRRRRRRRPRCGAAASDGRPSGGGAVADRLAPRLHRRELRELRVVLHAEAGETRSGSARKVLEVPVLALLAAHVDVVELVVAVVRLGSVCSETTRGRETAASGPSPRAAGDKAEESESEEAGRRCAGRRQLNPRDAAADDNDGAGHARLLALQRAWRRVALAEGGITCRLTRPRDVALTLAAGAAVAPGAVAAAAVGRRAARAPAVYGTPSASSVAVAASEIAQTAWRGSPSRAAHVACRGLGLGVVMCAGRSGCAASARGGGGERIQVVDATGSARSRAEVDVEAERLPR